MLLATVQTSLVQVVANSAVCTHSNMAGHAAAALTLQSHVCFSWLPPPAPGVPLRQPPAAGIRGVLDCHMLTHACTVAQARLEGTGLASNLTLLTQPH